MTQLSEHMHNTNPGIKHNTHPITHRPSNRNITCDVLGPRPIARKGRRYNINAHFRIYRNSTRILLIGKHKHSTHALFCQKTGRHQLSLYCLPQTSAEKCPNNTVLSGTVYDALAQLTPYILSRV
jgi:hypothetical protein